MNPKIGIQRETGFSFSLFPKICKTLMGVIGSFLVFGYVLNLISQLRSLYFLGCFLGLAFVCIVFAFDL